MLARLSIALRLYYILARMLRQKVESRIIGSSTTIRCECEHGGIGGAMKILLVEDSGKTGAYLVQGLREAGFLVDPAMIKNPISTRFDTESVR